MLVEGAEKLLRRSDYHRACRLWRLRAGFGCAAVLFRCLLKGIVINRDSIRRTSSTCIEQLTVKVVRAVLRQYVAGLVRTAAFLGLLSLLCSIRCRRFSAIERRFVGAVAVSSA